MTQPTFGASSAERDGLTAMKIVSDKNANAHSLRNTLTASTVATVLRDTVVYAGNVENGMRPVRLEVWISGELLEPVE